MSLPRERLHGRSLYSRRELGTAEWKLGLCLLAWQRRGDFELMGYSSVTEYAEKALQLSGQKLATLLATARALEHLPLFSEAYRRGDICWSKIRAIQTLVTPSDEHLWLRYARMARSDEVARKVAASPKQWKRQKALQAFLDGKPLATPEAVAKLLDSPLTRTEEMGGQAMLPDQPSSHLNSEDRVLGAPDPEAQSGASTLGETVSHQPGPAAAACSEGTVYGCRSGSRTSQTSPSTGARPCGGEDGDGEPRLDFAPKMVRLSIEMTSDQFALYESARLLLRARTGGRRATQGAILALMAEEVLNKAPARARAKHMIIVHTNNEGDQAWYETSRGILPVGTENQQRARSAASLATRSADKEPFIDEPDSHRADLGVSPAASELDRDAVGEEGPESLRESSREPLQDSNRESPRESSQQSPRGSSQEPPRGSSQESPREPSRESPRGSSRKVVLETAQGTSLGPNREVTRETCGAGPRLVSREPARVAVPFGVLRALFARSGGRCERCGGRGTLQVHHRDRVSDGGGNDLERLEHLCNPCHFGEHQKDYRAKPHWVLAREKGRARGRSGGG